MKVNLGCGNDVKNGYVNVDLYPVYEGVMKMDLSKLPWGFDSASCSEVLMLDFLEHFSYKMTKSILDEVFRILKPGGFVDIQVPDFEHCALAAMEMLDYLCNVCGNSSKKFSFNDKGVKACEQCNTPTRDIASAAVHRLYGGQDRDGNWHFTAFTRNLLHSMLKDAGFENMELLEKHHQWKNWNFKMRAYKPLDEWG